MVSLTIFHELMDFWTKFWMIKLPLNISDVISANEHPSEVATAGVLLEKVLLEILQKFTAKHLCQGLFFKKLQTWSMQLY